MKARLLVACLLIFLLQYVVFPVPLKHVVFSASERCLPWRSRILIAKAWNTVFWPVIMLEESSYRVHKYYRWQDNQIKRWKRRCGVS